MRRDRAVRVRGNRFLDKGEVELECVLGNEGAVLPVDEFALTCGMGVPRGGKRQVFSSVVRGQTRGTLVVKLNYVTSDIGTLASVPAACAPGSTGSRRPWLPHHRQAGHDRINASRRFGRGAHCDGLHCTRRGVAVAGGGWRQALRCADVDAAARAPQFKTAIKLMALFINPEEKVTSEMYAVTTAPGRQLQTSFVERQLKLMLPFIHVSAVAVDESAACGGGSGVS